MISPSFQLTKFLNLTQELGIIECAVQLIDQIRSGQTQIDPVCHVDVFFGQGENRLLASEEISMQFFWRRSCCGLLN